MDFDESPEDVAFRAEARAFLEEHADPELARDIVRRIREDDHWVAAGKVWQSILADHGWAGIAWPRAYGGRGGTPGQQAIFNEEAARFGMFPGMFVVGIGMAGPTIIAHGTDEQKQRYLPPMLRADEVWCQLFSEPGAGSDLAGLSTRAVRDGDEWVINGQKVWTSDAVDADLGMLLARTDPDQPKHRGITFFAIDMRQPGIDIRPLKQMTGASHFNEVFLTDARVSNDAIIGGLNAGWGTAMTTLANERTFMGGGQSSSAVTWRDLIEMAQKNGAARDPRIRQRLAASYSRAQIMRYLSMRARTAASHGRPPGNETSIMKLFAAWNLKHNVELAMAVQGAAGMLKGEDAPLGGVWQQSFLGAPSIRIAGGSDEVQRNVIGERTLGLPPEPRLD